MANPKDPDRTFVRDGIFHLSLSNVRNQVQSPVRAKAGVADEKSPQTLANEDIFKHLRPGDASFYLTDEELDLIAFYDGLPGCHTFRYLMRKLEREIKRSKRYQRPCSVVMVGVDGLDAVEAQFGVLAVDSAVFSVIQFLLDVIRSEVDMAGRLADDRYILVLPETPGRGAAVFCERMSKLFTERQIKYNWHVLPISLSFGIAYYPGHDEDPRELIARADLACEFVQARGGRGYAFAPEG